MVGTAIVDPFAQLLGSVWGVSGPLTGFDSGGHSEASGWVFEFIPLIAS